MLRVKLHGRYTAVHCKILSTLMYCFVFLNVLNVWNGENIGVAKFFLLEE